MTRQASNSSTDDAPTNLQQQPTRLGRYTLLEQIGEGGMAQVFKARATGIEGFEKIVVVKRILPGHAKNKAFIDMLIAEAKVCSVLDHPNIVPIHELGASGDVYYIVMEYVGGLDLLQLFKLCGDRGRHIPIEIALYIISSVADALAYAHRAMDQAGRPLNIVHRDVSPSNVIVSRDGVVKLTDFGVARADMGRTPVAAKSDNLRGKLSYLSPEIASGRPIDHRSDVFALGTLLWESLTLKRLFMGKSHAATLANVRDVRVAKRFKRHAYIPQGVQSIIERALQLDPADRYPTADAMAEAIQDYLFHRRLRVSARSVAEFIRSVEGGQPLADPTTSLLDLTRDVPPNADPDTLVEVERPGGGDAPVAAGASDIDDLLAAIEREMPGDPATPLPGAHRPYNWAAPQAPDRRLTAAGAQHLRGLRAPVVHRARPPAAPWRRGRGRAGEHRRRLVGALVAQRGAAAAARALRG